ncbi:Uncharacterised protein [Vibrio cholerae]|nr:Uncharacterised protein [Vibrio cholerae]CSI96364.1 Uncharacterised protein [Vibrio cholerae]
MTTVSLSTATWKAGSQTTHQNVLKRTAGT